MLSKIRRNYRNTTQRSCTEDYNFSFLNALFYFSLIIVSLHCFIILKRSTDCCIRYFYPCFCFIQKRIFAILRLTRTSSRVQLTYRCSLLPSYPCCRLTSQIYTRVLVTYRQYTYIYPYSKKKMIYVRSY